MTCRQPVVCAGVSPGVVNHINNSLQALVNLFYLIARDGNLDPELQTLVTETQVELARLSRLAKELIPAHEVATKPVRERRSSVRPRHREAGACL